MGDALLTWIGGADLRSLEQGELVGPIAQAVREIEFDHVVLLGSFDPAECGLYSELLTREVDGKVELQQCDLENPTDYSSVLGSADEVVQRVLDEHEEVKLTFHLTPGTPTMHAVWLLLGKARYEARLLQSMPGGAVDILDLPFEMSVDLRPTILRSSPEELHRLLASISEDVSGFDSIIHESDEMKNVVARARVVSQTDLPVLIYGETGTGKEEFARSIHYASARREEQFHAINCAAIPSELIESTLFGHVRGAFTGALRDKKGSFREANKGTLFLDEIGDLPLSAQGKLLRTLQEGEVMPVGGDDVAHVDVRIVAATHRDIGELVRIGDFREDLLMRIEVAVLEVPPLRQRGSDVGLLARYFWDRIQAELDGNPVYRRRELSAGADNALKAHRWPGNVRELENVLKRAGLWATGDQIEGWDIKNAIITRKASDADTILHREIEEGFDLELLIQEVQAHYVSRAYEASEGNKALASRMLGFPNPTKFSRLFDRLRS